MSKKHLGYSEEERSKGPYGRFYDPDLKPLSQHVVDALLMGSVAHELIAPVSAAPELHKPGYQTVETGYARAPCGAIRIACLTPMPRVSPHMWDWWFGWHGCEARRYQLWHPHAHVSAQWADGGRDERYIGRTSLIREYLGSELKSAGISFVAPSVMGLDEALLKKQGEIAVCARIGVPGTPAKGGWLLHQLRPVDGGCEMRSRMWLGGENSAMGENPGAVARAISRVMRPLGNRMLPDAHELLVHNAQEMAHLAQFLPELYDAFGPKAAS
ncbi:MAG: hypothetical protein AAGG55_08615 [Pseudomonadota bacterium]